MKRKPKTAKKPQPKKEKTAKGEFAIFVSYGGGLYAPVYTSLSLVEARKKAENLILSSSAKEVFIVLIAEAFTPKKVVEVKQLFKC